VDARGYKLNVEVIKVERAVPPAIRRILVKRFAVLFLGWVLLEVVTAVVFFTFATFAPRS
jgi:hypothetical protein